VESEPEKGARFEVYLPRVDETTESVEHEEMAATRARRRKTVLIVEDEDAVKGLGSEFVKSAGHAVLTAKHGTEALAIVETSDEPIHILLTDVVMPKVARTGPCQTTKRPAGRPADRSLRYMEGSLTCKRRLLGGGFLASKAVLAQYAGLQGGRGREEHKHSVSS
jgi:CheY-like chemotaxis protein